MVTADAEGNVTFFCAFLDVSDGTTNIEEEYAAPITATLGDLADAICTAEGLPTGGMTLMQHRVLGVLPVIEPRATVLSDSVIPNGARVILTPGS